MQVALLAYDALPANVQQRYVELLVHHPRFQQDFAALMPKELEGEPERARWIFAQASTWPDIARSQPEFARNTWHYVNWPLLLERGRLATCAEARRAFPASAQRVAEILAARAAAKASGPAPSAPPAPAPSVLDALPNMRRVLADENASTAERALALSWVLHLVGDAHQPLHGVALFTGKRFPAGDRGGNDILLRGVASLHSVWDDLLGKDDATFAEVEAGALKLRQNAGLRRAARAPARILDPEAWVAEDCELARQAVYVPALLRAVERFEGAGGGADAKPEVSLKPAYLEHARFVARQRAVLAGARLAALLGAAAEPAPPPAAGK
jgi:hypothetical protein